MLQPVRAIRFLIPAALLWAGAASSQPILVTPIAPVHAPGQEGLEGSDDALVHPLHAQSHDGRFTVFETKSVNLAPGQHQGTYLYDAQNDSLQPIALPVTNALACGIRNDSMSEGYAISHITPNGEYIYLADVWWPLSTAIYDGLGCGITTIRYHRRTDTFEPVGHTVMAHDRNGHYALVPLDHEGRPTRLMPSFGYSGADPLLFGRLDLRTGEVKRLVPDRELLPPGTGLNSLHLSPDGRYACFSARASWPAFLVDFGTSPATVQGLSALRYGNGNQCFVDEGARHVAVLGEWLGAGCPSCSSGWQVVRWTRETDTTQALTPDDMLVQPMLAANATLDTFAFSGRRASQDDDSLHIQRLGQAPQDAGIPLTQLPLGIHLNGTGHSVVFTRPVDVTHGPGLAPGTRFAAHQLHRHDIDRDTTGLVSQSRTGPHPYTRSDYSSYNDIKRQISRDQRFVLMASTDRRVRPAGTSPGTALILRDLETGSVQLANQQPDGTLYPAPTDTQIDLSANGRFVVYLSRPEPTPWRRGAPFLLFDRIDQTTVPVAPNHGHSDVGWLDGADAQASDDGQRVVFTLHSQLSSSDTNQASDVVLWNRSGDTLQHLHLRPDGQPASGGSGKPMISPDGRRVVFMLDGARDTPAPPGEYLSRTLMRWDEDHGTRPVLPRSDESEFTPDGDVASLSPDGRYVLFRSGELQATVVVDLDTDTVVHRNDILVLSHTRLLDRDTILQYGTSRTDLRSGRQTPMTGIRSPAHAYGSTYGSTYGSHWLSDRIGTDGASWLRREATPLSTGNWWWQPESGWGLAMFDQGSRLAAVVYANDDDGAPRWYLAHDLTFSDDGSMSSPLLRFEGEPFTRTPSTPVRSTHVGHLRIQWTYTGQMEAAISLDRIRFRTNQMMRFPFPQDILCFDPDEYAPSGENFSAPWGGGPGEDGWGVQLLQSDNAAHLAIYTYGEDGQPVFLIGNATRQGPRSFAGDLLRSGPGRPFHDTFAPWQVPTAETVGHIRLDFESSERGILQVEWDGAQRSIPIIRQRFGSIDSRCESMPY